MISNTKTKPFIKWAGGKSQLLPEIAKRLPDSFEHYFEPFLGGGALYFYLHDRIQTAYLSDVNEDLINAYRIVKEELNELVIELSCHGNSENYYYQIRDVDRSPEYAFWSPAQRAARFVYLNKTCFNGLYRVNSKGHFNTPFGHYQAPNILDRDVLDACNLALTKTKTTLVCGTYDTILKSITQMPDPSKAFVYFDPPYVPLTKTSSFVGYSKGGFGLKEQEDLARFYGLLTTIGVKCMLSNSSTPTVFDLYKDYTIHSVSAKRSISSTNSGRRPVLEVLVTNY